MRLEKMLCARVMLLLMMFVEFLNLDTREYETGEDGKQIINNEKPPKKKAQ